MKCTINIGLFLLLTLISASSYSQKYKQMMDDFSFNVYDVVKEANLHFDKVGRGKGTGYKSYQRWLKKNEMAFFPSGDRRKFNPYVMVDAYKGIKRLQSSNNRTNDYDWTDHGPYNVDSVTTHYAPGIGIIECVYTDPNNANKMYIASRSGGFWRSENGGLTWANTTDALSVTGVKIFSVNPQNTNDILINSQSSSSETTFGVYRSLDGGLTWTSTIFNPTNNNIGGLGTNDQVYDIKFHPTRPDTIFICSSVGLFRSIDNLNTINQVTTFGTRNIEVHPSNPNTVYVVPSFYWDRNRIYRSTNGGGSFSLIHEISNNEYYETSLSTTKANPNAVFFTSGKGIWRSLDSGNTFNFIAGSDQYGDAFGVSDINQNIFVMGGIDVSRSLDGGVTFTKVTEWYQPNATLSNYVHADLRNVYYTGGVLYIGTDGFFARSYDNGLNWTLLNNGTGTRENYRLGVSQSDANIASCGSQDNGSSYFKHGQWIEWMGADGMEQIIHPMNPDYAIGNIQFGSKFITNDGAQTGSFSNNHPLDEMDWIAPLAYNPKSFNTIYSVGENIYRSNDFGKTYSTLASFGTDATNFAIAENNSDIMLVSFGASLQKSINGGVTFSPIGTSVLPNKFISDIAFDPQNDNVIIVTYSHYENDNARIFISQNGGVSWTNITYNLSAIPIRSVVIDHSINRTIYLGTEIGVFAKAMSAGTYALFSDNLPPVAINELEINYGSNKIYAASWGRGLWSAKLADRANYPVIKKVTMSQNPADGINNTATNIININFDQAITVTQAFVKWSTNNISLNQMIPLVKLNQNEYAFNSNLMNGSSGDSIYFKIFLIGSNSDTTSSYRFMFKLKSIINYCDAQGSNGTTADYIDKVKLGVNEHVSGKSQYSNFTNIIFPINQYDSLNLLISLDYAFVDDEAGAWVDWNKSGSFDTNEKINLSSYVNNDAVGKLKVPTFVEPGQYRLRTRNSYFSTPSPCDEDAGEVEDYTISVISTCSSNPIVSNINDRYAGSLRYWLDNACVNDTIYFSPSLSGATIALYSSELATSKSLSIDGNGANNVSISGNNNFRIFNINHPTNLINLNLINGYGLTNGGAFYNTSQVTLRNMILSQNKEGLIPKAFTSIGNIQVLTGVSQIK
jgi:hypothetical protein